MSDGTEYMLTVEDLAEHLKKYGPWAAVYATEGKITFYDNEEGGQELGHILTPDGLPDKK